MRRAGWLTLLLVTLILGLTACGEKTQEEVVEDLDHVLQDLEGYKAEATMVLETGEEPREYDVGIWHMQTDSNQYYRVELNNEDEEQNQLILRNDDGVFVLTPALNKRFRFQSDWPNNNSQVYLYESLISDILMDADRTFAIEEDQYVFETKTHYQNKNLHSQEVILDRRSLTPETVKIFDPDYEPLVEVTFHSFDTDVTFDEDDFEMDKNMTAAQLDVPAHTDEFIEEEHEQEVFMPNHELQGTSLAERETVEGERGDKTILTYEGERPYTIIQQPAAVMETSTYTDVGAGDPVQVGETYGYQTADTLQWTSDATEFMIASDALTEDEMLTIAESMNTTTEK
ncbi:LolA family protein [Salsuginibacillus kocurii]|uniref:LolA family protein n=1 Tax=Salsuginibacillus kocurii TaxID=427078 RepID=UPI0003648536|nr:outer membrane lipoprotein carrier protein LolA [Salsuginibacillus kocurii]